MPTVLTHAALGAGIYLAAGHGRPGARAGAFAAAAIATIPDIDSLFMRWIPYEAAFGHRGMTHSLAFAAALGLAAALVLKRRVAIPGGFPALAALLAAAAATHGPLDALTDGGLGVAFFAPFSPARIAFAWRPIPVAPLGYHPYVFTVIAMEAVMLWPAAIALATARARLSPLTRLLVLATVAASAVPWLIGMGLRPV